jgi:predicted TPR repeat methyltransferase
VDKLQYRTPEYLHDALTRVISADKGSLTILDLGCGTGLCAPFLRPWAKRLIGVDLSAKMIEKARHRKLYDELIVDDMLVSMKNSTNRFDLICAADVMVYVGDLDAVFRAAKASLGTTGWFAFSTEHLDGEENYLLRTSGRYAHSPRYIRDLAARHGLAVMNLETQVIRMEADQPITGDIFILIHAGSA